MKKTWFLGLSFALCLALFTGCASNADTMPQATPHVSTAPMNTVAPMTTMAPTASSLPDAAKDAVDNLLPGMDASATSGANTVQDAKRVSERVKDEVEKLSELDDAEAVVAGSIALVGVEYNTQYQGGLDDRLREMITERVEMIDKAITTVHVTDDPEAVRKIATLYERLDDNGITFSELQTEVLDIASGMTASPSPNPTAGTSAGKK